MIGQVSSDDYEKLWWYARHEVTIIGSVVIVTTALQILIALCLTCSLDAGLEPRVM